MTNLSIKTGSSLQIRRTVYDDAHKFDGDRINALAFTPDGTIFIGGEYGLFFFDGKAFVKFVDILYSVDCVFCSADGKVFAGSGKTVYTCKDKIITDTQECKDVIVNICADDMGAVWLLTRGHLYKYNGKAFELYSGIDFHNTNVFTACQDGKIYAACDKAFMALHGKRPRWGTMTPGLTHVPEAKITCLKADKLGHVWVGCENGLYIYDGKSTWISPDQLDYFPKCRITSITFGDEQTVFLGTDIGLYMVTPAKTRFFGEGRYLPASYVNSVAVNSDNSEIWVGTDKGMARIQLIPMTLEEKEAYYESVIPYCSREDFVTSRVNMLNGDPDTGNVFITDNDGLWTAVYTASQCLKYAVTKSDAALIKARNSMNAILKLMTMTGIDGFPARAYRRPGEYGFGNGHHEWHLASDDKGPLEWKGETSSDELVGHFMAASFYCRFCADQKEKAYIGKVLQSVIEHIYSHNFTLCDVDGLPTTWSQFGPDELNGNEMWIWEKGINSLELLSFMRIAQDISGDDIYSDRINELLTKHHYAINTLTYKVKDNHANHVDDRLGFYIMIPMLMTENDPDLLRYLQFALRRHFEYECIENNPLFAFANAVFTGSTKGLTEGIQTLEEYPIDLLAYRTVNSIRPDITVDHGPEEFGDRPQSLNALPASERIIDALSQNAFSLDCGDKNELIAPTTWLFAYWFGRYFGIID